MTPEEEALSLAVDALSGAIDYPETLRRAAELEARTGYRIIVGKPRQDQEIWFSRTDDPKRFAP